MKLFFRVLIGLILLFLLLGLLTPKQHLIVREIVIDAPQELVRDQVNDLKKWDTWSPWEQADASLKKTYGPATEGNGAYYTWESKHSGKGKLTITGTSADSINTEVIFEGMGKAKSKYAFTKQELYTKVVWSFDYNTPFPWNAVNWVMGGDKSVGKEFEKGLASLKQVCEQLKLSSEKKYRGFTVKPYNVASILYAFKRKTITIKEIPSFLGKSFDELTKVIKDQKVTIIGPNTTLYWSLKPDKNETDIGAAFPVDKTISGNTEMSTIELGGKAFIIDYYGPYKGLSEAHNAMEDYLKDKSIKRKSPVIEQYVIDARSQRDTSKWLTKLIYFMKEDENKL
jgi:effector-binding domain-containing protein